MTRLEDALRATLAADSDPDGDPAPDLERWLPGIRQGARRRRTARQVVAAGVAATVALGAMVGYALTRSDDAPPAPTERHLGTPSPPPWSPRSLDVVGDALFVLDTDVRCQCTRILRTTGTQWTVVGEIPVWGLLSLDFTSDGSTGWVADGDQVWVSHDEGRSWSAVPLSGQAHDSEGGLATEVSVLADDVWTTDQDGGVWRLPAGTDRPQRVDIDGITVATSVKAVGGSLFVTGSSEATSTDLASSDVLRVSDDGGTGWTPLAAPCTSAQVTAAAGAVFAVCHDATGDRATVHRWTPGQDRFEEYAATVLSEAGILLALDDERLAITDDADERILTATTDIPTDFAQSDDTSLIDSAVLGERLYVVSLAGMSMSEDGGRTWSQISQ